MQWFYHHQKDFSTDKFKSEHHENTRALISDMACEKQTHVYGIRVKPENPQVTNVYTTQNSNQMAIRSFTFVLDH